MAQMNYCAIDFGTSNSAVALPAPAGEVGAPIRLAPVEGLLPTLPTAVFFNVDEGVREFGRAAVQAYVDGYDGRLMRSLKSILGSSLAEQTTEIGDGSAIRFIDVIALFLQHLKDKAEAVTQTHLERAVLGRPVFFVDDDPVADRMAQNQLAQAAQAVGLSEIHFQYEPIAAAFDYESRLQEERLALVVDIGGGTSDFSLVRVGPQRVGLLDRSTDVLGHHGVHMAGTDFDRRVELASIMSELGYRTLDPEGREVPNRVYFDLSTWHLINSVYAPRRVGEFRLLKHLYNDTRYHDRLLRVIERRLGHALMGRAERAKIDVAAGGQTSIDLDQIEDELVIAFNSAQLMEAGAEETQRIVDAARATVEMAGVRPEQVAALYFTGGSTGLKFLTEAIAAQFPAAAAVFGDPLASVAQGLGIHARHLFAPRA